MQLARLHWRADCLIHKYQALCYRDANLTLEPSRLILLSIKHVYYCDFNIKYSYLSKIKVFRHFCFLENSANICMAGSCNLAQA